MTLSADQRMHLAEFAKVMIPGGADMPSAEDLMLWRDPIDEVLAIDPSRLEPMVRFLDLPGNIATLADVEALAQTDRAGFEALGIVLANAYFMHPQTRAAIGYPGQEARDSSGGLTPDDEALLKPVIARGPIYRSP